MQECNIPGSTQKTSRSLGDTQKHWLFVWYCFVFRNGKIIIKHIVLINQKKALEIIS